MLNDIILNRRIVCSAVNSLVYRCQVPDPVEMTGEMVQVGVAEAVVVMMEIVIEGIDPISGRR